MQEESLLKLGKSGANLVQSKVIPPGLKIKREILTPRGKGMILITTVNSICNSHMGEEELKGSCLSTFFPHHSPETLKLLLFRWSQWRVVRHVSWSHVGNLVGFCWLHLARRSPVGFDVEMKWRINQKIISRITNLDERNQIPESHQLGIWSIKEACYKLASKQDRSVKTIADVTIQSFQVRNQQESSYSATIHGTSDLIEGLLFHDKKIWYAVAWGTTS